MPIYMELKVWRELWPRIRERKRWRRSALIAMLVLGLGFVPWPGRVMSSGLLRPVEIWPVFAPAGAMVERAPIAESATVAAHSELMALLAPELVVRRNTALARLDRLRLQSASSGYEAESRNRMQSTYEELATVQAELASVQEELTRYQPHAPFAGRLRDLDPDLQPGQWLARKEKIGVLVADGSFLVETYLDEDAVKRVEPGDGGVFMIDSLTGPVLRLKVLSVDADATRILPNGLLAAQAGGHVLAREKNGQYFPERSVYRVALAVQSPMGDLGDHSWRGHVVIRADWEVPVWRYLRNGLSVLMREAGF